MMVESCSLASRSVTKAIVGFSSNVLLEYNTADPSKGFSAPILMHGSILPVTIPPGQPRGQVQSFGPGVGNCLKPTCPGGGGGKSNVTSCCSCKVRHFSDDAGPRGEDCLFSVRISRIYSRLVREE